MKWIEPKYSKERVKKAGNSLLKADLNCDEFTDAIPIFHNWRSSHAFPMQIMLDLLRKNSIKIDKNPLVVQRLKRVQSIFKKIVREQNMSLSRMQDIAGCRAVLSDVKKVNKVCKSLVKSRTKNIFYKEYNYIESPKESGYRGIHLIYKYNGSKEKYIGMLVELQIRSKIQHSWATAVEVVGTFTNQALKASSGDSEWLELFKFISVEFARLENCIVESRFKEVNTYEEMNKLINILELFERLTAFKVATKTLTEKVEKKAGYFVLLLDISDRVVIHTRFDKGKLDEATNYYNKLEIKHRDDVTKDVVLVSAASVRDLKTAYPNYFADTDEFVKNIKKVYSSYNYIFNKSLAS
ncbi:RelA/SpoT domain-containing protein [Shewanella sp. VB17]|uniref:RelA/SpoT domain-containing protein n=1 Tax=Shewanella sp. VB17 TaxID=2739432 RepID=UPI00156676E4|nr:RelA/SpoT domain-containing protein [Shewanella sp. VB17]NRD73226.1 RelA/SpoT domain-containing protein [Shewanella sp. VB17]